MKVLLHCDFDEHSIVDNFGLSEYSYWFVFESYRSTLEQLFDTQRIARPSEADAIFKQCQADNTPCVLLSFNPPHKTPLKLRCPVIPVFAWEFPDLPRQSDEKAWASDVRFDWEYVFRRVASAITLSSHTVRAVTDRLGPDYPITAIPAPLWDRQEAMRQRIAWRRYGQGHVLRLNASVVDCDTLGLDVDHYVSPQFTGEVHAASPQESDALLPAEPSIPPPGPVLARKQVDLRDAETAPSSSGWDIPKPRLVKTLLDGVVYTSVLTGADARKNWADILTAFVWAFRERENAVLVLKLGGADLIWQHQRLLDLLSRLSPYRCRVIVIYGYLDDGDYQNLMAATDFYVNASYCEGLCMPLMEYLASGIPAIAPAHTAMADYVNSDHAFVVESGEGSPTVWPHGDRLINRTTHPRLDWHSLMSAFRASHGLILGRPQDYARMSAHAMGQMREYCGDVAVKARLREFLVSAGASALRTGNRPGGGADLPKA